MFAVHFAVFPQTVLVIYSNTAQIYEIRSVNLKTQAFSICTGVSTL
jgi:hypothetical protein